MFRGRSATIEAEGSGWHCLTASEAGPCNSKLPEWMTKFPFVQNA
jgi:hypothetical protein